MNAPHRHRLAGRLAVLMVVVPLAAWAGGVGPASAGMPPTSITGSSPKSPSTLPWPQPARTVLPQATAKLLQSQLEDYVKQNSLVGASAAVVTASGSWAGGAGVDGRNTPIRANSAMAIASTTKTFVAAEVLLLSQRGKIRLDAPVTRYVKLPFDTRGATIRQLATMTSGFPGILDSTVLAVASANLDRKWTCADTLALVPPKAEHIGVRGGPAAYNGLNYLVLGMVIEKVTGRPLASVLRNDLLDPSGLHRIWTETGAAPERPTPPRALPVDDPIFPVVDSSSGYLPSAAAATSFCGGTGIAADALDLARWGYLLYGGRVINNGLVAVMTTPNPQGGDFNYGFGTMIADWDGSPFWGHAGNYAQYTSILFVWPATKTTVVVLVPMPGGPDNNVRADLAVTLYLTTQQG